MNILVVHNRYLEPGGEDRVVERETALLTRHGHTAVPFTLDNHALAGMSRMALATRTIWNSRAFRAVAELIGRERIELMHVHNTLPLASPAVYYAAQAHAIPVVQTIHNYRLICPNAVCVRDGQPCVACVGVAPLPAIRHGCYRGSRTATAGVSAMLLVHRAAGTWVRRIDTYISPTRFARDLLVAGGLPAERIAVKPHFVDPDEGVGHGAGGHALYVGRLSEEKGVRTLLDAWRRLQAPIPLVIVGDGPLAGEVAAAAASTPTITWMGRQSAADTQRRMREAALLVAPSIAFETFGQAIAEALCAGTPVVASAGGAAGELVDPGRTGELARPGDAADLARTIDRLVADPARLHSMRAAARAAFERRFTADGNYTLLMDIYRKATARRRRHPATRHAGRIDDIVQESVR